MLAHIKAHMQDRDHVWGLHVPGHTLSGRRTSVQVSLFFSPSGLVLWKKLKSGGLAVSTLLVEVCPWLSWSACDGLRLRLNLSVRPHQYIEMTCKISNLIFFTCLNKASCRPAGLELNMQSSLGLNEGVSPPQASQVLDYRHG